MVELSRWVLGVMSALGLLACWRIYRLGENLPTPRPDTLEHAKAREVWQGKLVLPLFYLAFLAFVLALTAWMGGRYIGGGTPEP